MIQFDLSLNLSKLLRIGKMDFGKFSVLGMGGKFIPRGR